MMAFIGENLFSQDLQYSQVLIKGRIYWESGKQCFNSMIRAFSAIVEGSQCSSTDFEKLNKILNLCPCSGFYCSEDQVVPSQGFKISSLNK